MKNTVFLSIIIPAFNQIENVDNLCKLIFKKKNVEIEVIIVDDGSKISFQKIKDKYPIKYFKIKNSGPSYARNYGAKQSKGKYLLFLDSDVLISTNMIVKIINFQKKEKKKILSIFYSEHTIKKNISHKYKAYLDYYFNRYNKKSSYINSLHGSSCVFQREVFLKLGGWSEDFKGATLENEEFAHRILRFYNNKIYFNSELYVHHNYANFNVLLKNIFLRSILWIQLKLSNKVNYDGLVRTRLTGLITIQSFFILLFFPLINLNENFIYPLIINILIYLIGNIGFYKYLFKRENIFNFIKLILFNFIFHLSVSIGAIIGVLLYKFFRVKY